MSNANYKDGIVRDGSSIGNGTILGNIKNGIIRKGTSSSAGNGDIQGNVKGGVVRKGASSSIGNGDIIMNIKDGVVRVGSSSSLGNGDKKGSADDYAIKGMERELDADMVATYHFLVKKIV